MIQQSTEEIIADSQTPDRLLKAMHLVEQANALLVQAGIEINRVEGARAEYARTCNAYERLRTIYSRLRHRREMARSREAVAS